MRNLREHPKGSGRYEYAFYNKHKKPKRKVVRFAASSYEAAMRMALKKLEAYEAGDFDPWKQIIDDIEEAMKAYMKAHRNQRKNTKTGKQSTFNMFLKYINVRSFFSVDDDVIGNYAVHFEGHTLKTRLQILNHFWKWAIREGYTRKNPVRDYVYKNRITKKLEKRRDAMSVDEYLQVYGEAMKQENYFPLMLELGVCTGLRRGELISLNVQDVTTDGKTGSINIREWHSPYGESFYPKNENATRVVPLVPRAAALLKGILNGINTDDPWQSIFLSPFHDNRRVRGNDASDRFRTCRDAVGLSKSITFHSTRHSFLSWLIMLSTDPYAVMSIAGHEDLTIQRRYIHFSKLMLSGGANQMRRKIVSYLCPGVNESALEFTFPDTASWYGSVSASSRLDVLDILFGGLLYDEELIASLKQFQMQKNIKRN